MTSREEALEVAAGIGLALAREAIWHEDRCNWVGPALDPGGRTAYDEHSAALDPYPYEGTSGVALFLGELHAVTGEDAPRRTALGAIRQSLRAAGRAESPRLGLYDGDVGVAVVAARLAALLDEPALAAGARELLDRLPLGDPDADRGESDLLTGAGGAAVGLLIAARLLDEPRLADAAVMLGERVLERGEQTVNQPGISWASPAGTATRNLTGLAHGAAGIAHALLVLAEATGRADFAAGAAGAFEYERATFDEQARNWPDFRTIVTGRGSGPSFGAFWCHGGPGIALARVTALARADDAALRADLEAGIAVARGALEGALRHGGGNFSLCHGLAGNGDILLDCASAAGDGEAERLALAVAGLGAERHAGAGDWPSGVMSGRPAPGLMLGRAGAGHFYLRLARPEVPSVLLPAPTPPNGGFSRDSS